MTPLLRVGDRFDGADRPDLNGVVVGIELRDGTLPTAVPIEDKPKVARFTVQAATGRFESLSFHGFEPARAPVRPSSAPLH